jgi:hypothetical protein
LKAAIKNIGIIAIFNGIIAIFGLAVVLILSKTMSPHDFGLLMSQVAAQNMWASIGLFRVESQLIKHDNITTEIKLMQGGMYAILFASVLLSLAGIFLGGYISSVFIGGLSLILLDSCVLYFAKKSKTVKLILAKGCRVALPFIIYYIFHNLNMNISETIILSSFIMLIISAVIWSKFLKLKYSISLIKEIYSKYWSSIRPTLLLSIINGVWLNALVPMSGLLINQQTAGSLGLIQKTVGGSIGIFSNGVSLYLQGRLKDKIVWRSIRNILILQVIFGAAILIAFNILTHTGTMLNEKNIYTANWQLFAALYFLISSIVGSISFIALKYSDELFLLYWQIIMIITTILICSIINENQILQITFVFGIIGYIILLYRWYLIIRNENDLV